MKKCVVLFIFLSTLLYAEEGDLQVEVKNLKNQKGALRLLVFKKEDGFPDEVKKSARSLSLEKLGSKSALILKRLPYGRYAVSVIHDENGNGELDSNWVGMPKEGYGVSNNITYSYRPPKFFESTFSLEKPKGYISIELKYPD